ncbi:class I SAM-dependent DNA methyltransferase [Microbispora sp. GKU 823]|uniref:class I SAM-dependent DNA methyltransferase n=1 Tax=Microbispora sp. GKU 823 TaxID=1652100 RepID=UPI0009A3E34C|nr:class I SAM-dependent DNA methyltransferase [Microbispora sp. GKU 823]OPG14160.1 restriction endonuclease subunit M [Microbispora sp. GKU 823]
MPPRKKNLGQGDLPGMPTMADLRETLWKAADKLRGSMDAAQYKDFVLGLVFLKYISDAFDERREQIKEEVLADGIPETQLDTFLNDIDEYTGHGVFWVPESARWSHLAANAKSAGIGQLLDGAMQAIMDENPPLKGVLAKIFNRENVDQRRLGELVVLISDARFTGHGDRPARDVLGEVYEYFLEKFARAEGKRGGEFYTPSSVVRLLVEVLEPYEGRIYDPCCGSGGMFVQAEKFVEAHRGKNHRADLAVYGQEANERTWRLAKMNLAIHGIGADLSSTWADTFYADKHPDLKADYVLANPPFNMSDWHRVADDPRWRFGAPPPGNANFAWIQHIIAKLGERGSAGVVMANGSMSSKQSGEGEIRRNLVEHDLVACMIALPPQLFRTTQIPACLWFFAKDKSGRDGQHDRQGEVLFIDARNMGTMVDRTERVLTDEDLARIAGTYHAWRGTASAREAGLIYEDVPGFCCSASKEEIGKHDYVLTPGQYVGAAEVDDANDEPIAEKIQRLKKELFSHFEESARLEEIVRKNLERLDA